MYTVDADHIFQCLDTEKMICILTDVFSIHFVLKNFFPSLKASTLVQRHYIGYIFARKLLGL